MKGIALEMIAYYIIAFVTIVLILGLIGMKISPALKNAFCSVMRGITGVLPLPDYMRPSLPAYCEGGNGGIKVVTIESKYPDRIALEIASHTLACWERTGKINLGQDKLCYELVLKEVGGEVNEDMVSDILKQQSTIMDWKAGVISSEKSIGISYNSESNKIEVS